MIKRARAIASIQGAEYSGAIPLPAGLMRHPATTAAPTETYSDPKDVGGWLYVIEDEAETWIAFIDVKGKALLWTSRDADGGVIGAPYGFQRADLALTASRVDAP